MAVITTQEGIVNLALSRVGAKGISDLDNDTTVEAVQARVVYHNTRDRLLRAHQWSFATRRVELTEASSGGSTVEPVFGWDKAYTLPSDYLRTVSVHASNDEHDQPEYKIEKLSVGGTLTDVILINSSKCFLRYIYQEADPSLWPGDFQDALAWAIAAELALVLPVSRSTYKLLAERAERTLLYAKSVEGIEDFPERRPAGSWVTDRDMANEWGA